MVIHAPLKVRVLRSATATLALGVRAEAEFVDLCAPVRRIVTIHSGSLRELMLSLPALRALRETFEGAHITAVAREGLDGLLRACPLVDEVLLRPGGGLSGQAQLMTRLLAQRNDVAVSFSTSRNGVLLALSSGAHVRIGLDGAKMDALLTHRIAREEQSHQICTEDYLDLVRVLGCAPRCHDYSDLIHPSVKDEQAAARWLEERDITSEFVVLWPQPDAPPTRKGAGPSFDWTQVARELSQRRPIVIGGARKHSAFKAMPHIHDAGGALSISATAVLLARAKLFIGASSGAMHLAAAMNTPVVAIQPNQECGVDEPRGVPHRVLKSGVAPEVVVKATRELIGL